MFLELALAVAARGPIFSGLPPVRFQGDNRLGNIVFVSDITTKCGQPPKGYRFLGCVIDKIIYITNPCHSEGKYAMTLCHELGHVNGWTREHEY